MANDKNFKIKNGLSATRYLLSSGTATSASQTFDLSSGSYTGVSLSIGSQDPQPTGITFNDTGTKLFLIGQEFDSVYEYALSTAYDLSSASYTTSFSVSSQDSFPKGVAFSNSGSKMYISGAATNNVYQYSLSTAYDISTASYDSVSTSGGASITHGLFFKPDGTSFYVIDESNDTVRQYNLGTANNLSTASFANSFSVASQDNGAKQIVFKSDGTKMYLAGIENDLVYQYSLSTSWDISTAAYDSVSFSVNSQDTNPVSLHINNNGTKLFVLGQTNDTVFEYTISLNTQTLDLSTGNYFSFTPSGATTVSFTGVPASGLAVGFSVEVNGDGSAITWPTSVKWHEATAPTATANKELYTFVTTDGGTTYYGKKAAEGLA